MAAALPLYQLVSSDAREILKTCESSPIIMTTPRDTKERLLVLQESGKLVLGSNQLVKGNSSSPVPKIKYMTARAAALWDEIEHQPLVEAISSALLVLVISSSVDSYYVTEQLTPNAYRVFVVQRLENGIEGFLCTFQMCK